MELSKLFKPDYTKLILVLAGVTIGLTPSLPDWIWKITYFFIAAILIFFIAPKLERRDKDVNNG